MEWYIKGFDDPVESGTRVNSLVLTLTPESTALNGTSVVCKAFATSGEVYEGKVTIIVKGRISLKPCMHSKLDFEILDS